MSAIKVYHFHNGSGGGVLSVIKNLLRYSSNTSIENHVIFTINKDLVPEYEMPKLEGAVTQQIFYYSAKWNFYYTCKGLSKLLPDEIAVIVAHDWLELGMMSNLGLQNPVVQVVHGNYDYYYNLAQKHSNTIDGFICISPVIFKKLCDLLPDREKEIKYCRFPVPAGKALQKNNQNLKIFYCVRSLEDKNKQFALLPWINENLQAAGLKLDWTIVGNGLAKQEVKQMMNDHHTVSVFHSLTNEEVIDLLTQHDLFILPSLKEGFPVAVVEAMKAGLVPLVTNWENAAEELIVQGETGFYFETGDADGYAEAIVRLNSDRPLLKKMGTAGMKKANELFDPIENTKLFESVFLEAFNAVKITKKAEKVYGSRLDKKWISNYITKLLRKI